MSRTFVPDNETRSVLVVRTGLRGRHALAAVAPEGVLEHQRGDPELARLESLEDLLRVVGPVVVADARMIPPDDEVGAPVVLPADRVPDRLLRARVAHRRREHRDHRPVLRVVALEQGLVAAHPYVGRHVVGLRRTDQRVHQQPVDDLERALLDVLVRSVDRVASSGSRRPSAIRGGRTPPGSRPVGAGTRGSRRGAAARSPRACRPRSGRRPRAAPSRPDARGPRSGRPPVTPSTDPV